MSSSWLDPKQLSKELMDFSKDIEASCEALAHMPSVKVDTTPFEVIFSDNKLKLRYYPATTSKAKQTPLLICYALVNRPYVIDLDNQRSLVQFLNAQGLDVYLIDWGYPDRLDRYLDLDDYVNDYLDACVDQALTHAKVEQLNLLGICQGGTLSLCYTALHPEKVSRLITVVTPVDFHTPKNLLSHLMRQIDVGLIVDTFGNVPGSLLNQSFRSLMPARLGIEKYLSMPKQLADSTKAELFMRMERWINDSPDQAGEAFKEFVEQFFQQNRLVKGQVSIGEQTVDLKQITQPVLNIVGTHDHIVPPCASEPLGQLVGSDTYQYIAIEAGHIGVFVSKSAQAQLGNAIVDWVS